MFAFLDIWYLKFAKFIHIELFNFKILLIWYQILSILFQHCPTIKLILNYEYV